MKKMTVYVVSSCYTATEVFLDEEIAIQKFTEMLQAWQLSDEKIYKFIKLYRQNRSTAYHEKHDDITYWFALEESYLYY